MPADMVVNSMLVSMAAQAGKQKRNYLSCGLLAKKSLEE